MRSYLAVTRGGELSDLKALFDATKDNTNGIGSTDDGTLTVIDARSGATSTITDAAAALWPDGEAAPYVWAVAPDAGGDIDLYWIDNAPATVLDGTLLIDAELYAVARVQLGGSRPPDTLTVRARRVPRVVDASRRTVELVSSAKARITRARPPSGESIELASRNPLSVRNMGDSVVVWDTSANEYRVMPIRNLLAGAIEEQDTATRLVALKAPAMAGVVPSVTVAEIEAGESLVGLATGVEWPTPPADSALHMVVAVPQDDPFEYFAFGEFNTRNNRAVFPSDPNDTLTLTSGDSFDVYVSNQALTRLLFLSGSHGYFANDSVNP